MDVIIEIASRIEFNALEDKLRERGFSNVETGPICRFRHDILILDVMPVSPEILGFANPWYAAALARSEWNELGNGMQVRVITGPYFIVTKLAAFGSPDRENHHDYKASRDFEDVIALFDGREELGREIRECPRDVRQYISERLAVHLDVGDLAENVGSHLEPDAASQARVNLVIERMRRACQP